MTGQVFLRRLILAVPTLFGVGIVVFVLLRVVPGDPIAMMIPANATPADILALRHLYGLDSSIPVQMLVWAQGLLHGQLGVSISLRQNVLGLVLARLPATLELAVLAIWLAVSGGVLLAVLGVFWRGRWPEAIIDAVLGLAQSIPDFLWGVLFILLLGVFLPILPISGRVDPMVATQFHTQFFLLESLFTLQFHLFGQILAHMILPAVSLALPLMAIIGRVLKASLQEAMQQDYILLARIKGFPRHRIILREALRNAAIPAFSLTGVQFSFLLGNTVLIERLFSYPGIGNMAIDAVINRDLPLIQGLILTYAVLFIAINLLIDFGTNLLNPRLRHAA